MNGSLFGGYLNLANENLSFGIITVCAVCVFVLLANVLRRKIPLFRRSLMPTAVIAGLLGLVIKEIAQALTGINIFNTMTLGAIVYHMLPVGFIALCLRERDNYAHVMSKDKPVIENVAPIKSGSLIISTYLLQGIIGVIVTVSLALTFMPELNQASGIMLALGFGQGPQQANATGIIWDAEGYMAYWGAMAREISGLR